jgi:hypothetical protein
MQIAFVAQPRLMHQTSLVSHEGSPLSYALQFLQGSSKGTHIHLAGQQSSVVQQLGADAAQGVQHSPAFDEVMIRWVVTAERFLESLSDHHMWILS